MFLDLANSLHHWILHTPIARIFVIIALGYLVGEIRFPGGFRLGVAGVLFVGLLCGAMDENLDLPIEIQSLGLVLFVYCIGLQSGPGFLKSFKRDGLAMNASVIIGLTCAYIGAYLIIRWIGESSGLIAGLFCGALTSTPALGAITESIGKNGGVSADTNLVVVGFGIAYPISVLLVLIIVQLYSSKKARGELVVENQSSITAALTVVVENLQSDGQPWTTTLVRNRSGVILTRVQKPNAVVELVSSEMQLIPGCLVVCVGNAEQLKAAVKMLGHPSAISLQQELEGFEIRRYFVSTKQAVEKPIINLGLERLGAVVSHLVRGDLELPINEKTTLQLGDRIQVVSYKNKEPEVRKFFGNSLTAFTETSYLSFSLGIILGLVIAQIPFTVPGLAQPVRLGIAGGPLIMALILGSLGRSGPFIWTLPTEINQTISNFGMLLFLSAVGVKAGHGFFGKLQEKGWLLLLLAVLIVLLAQISLLVALHIFGQRKRNANCGVVAGLQTQPAVLSFASTRVENGPLNTSYATTYPIAVILKIILAQLLLL